MRFGSSFLRLVKDNGILTAQRVGVNDASTFTGFCHKHDSQTFAPIDQPVKTLTDEHVFLSSYRAICRELFTKTAAAAEGVLRTSRQMDRGKDEAAQRLIQEFNASREAGLEAGLKDLRRIKAEYDKTLLDKAYEKVSYYAVCFDHGLPIACTVGFAPEIDFHGNRLQYLDKLNERVDSMTCSVLRLSGGSTAVILAWLLDKSGGCGRLIQSLNSLKQSALPTAIVRLIFEHGENVFFTPSWWEGLEETSKKTIERHANSFHDKPEGALSGASGPLQILWSVVDTRTILRC